MAKAGGQLYPLAVYWDTGCAQYWSIDGSGDLVTVRGVQRKEMMRNLYALVFEQLAMNGYRLI